MILLAKLLQAEQLHRSNERMSTLVKAARFRYNTVPENIECTEARNLSKAQLATLLDGRYLAQGENILITGATGCGKSAIA